MTVDKRIPLALVVTIIIQSLCFAAWIGSYISTTDKRLEHIETWISDNTETRERLAVLEIQIRSMNKTLERIEGKLNDR